MVPKAGPHVACLLQDLSGFWHGLPLPGGGGHAEGDASAAHEGDADHLRGEGGLAVPQEIPIDMDEVL